MKRRLLLTAVVALYGALAAGNEKADDPRVKIADVVSMGPSGNPELPWAFNRNCLFVVSFNSSIPLADRVKESLFSNLGARNMLERTVFDFFSGDRPPEFIELKIGSRVPVELAQAVIQTFSDARDLPVTTSLETEDSGHGSTQRVYIGSLIQKPRKPVTQGRFRALLRPGLSLDELHGLIRAGD